MKPEHDSRAQRHCDTAINWVVRLRSDHVSDQDRQDFALWLAQDRAHSAAIDSVLDMWDDLACLKHMPIEAEPRLAANAGSWLGASTAVAACLIASLFLWPLLFSVPETSEYSTAIGEQLEIVLTDQSRVILNTSTHVSVSYEDSQRHLLLHKGEAYFEVNSDPGRPFHVDTDSARVTAIGTTFNIYRHGENTDITVTEGVVRVTELGDVSNRAADVEIVRANQTVQVSPLGLKASAFAEIGDSIAWQQGELIAEAMTLSELKYELERYQSTRIIIDSPEVAALTVSGVFKLDNPAAILDALEVSHGLQAVQIGDDTVRLLKAQ